MAWLLLSVGGAEAFADPIPEATRHAPRQSARAAVLVDAATGTVLYARRARERRPPASTTKVMTALLALEFAQQDDVIVVSRRAARTGGSSMGIRAGERYRLRDLLYGLMLPSGNDAAVAVAEHVSGSVPRFAALMNQRARELGMTDTHFANPHGLPHAAHRASALDLARLARDASRRTELLRLTCTRRRDVCDLDGGRRLRLHNTNRLLWSFAYAEGVKTGTTTAAGRCLIAAASRRGRRLIAVVLRAPHRWRDARRLLQWGFDEFRLVRAGHAGDALGRLPVRGGTRGRVAVTLEGPLQAVVPRERADEVRLAVRLPESLAAPVYPYEPVGEASLLLDGRALAGVRAVAAQGSGRLTLVRRVAAWLLPLLRLVVGPAPR